MATENDWNCNAEYLKMADNVVDVPSGAGNLNFANVDLIVDIADRTQCDAVWVGWGFASGKKQILTILLIALIDPALSISRKSYTL